MNENLSIDYNEYDCSEVVVNEEDIKELEKAIDFTTVMMQVVGIIGCLTLIGVIVGIPLIIAASKLTNAKAKMQDYVVNGDMNNLKMSIKSVKAYFYLIMLISLIYFAIITFVAFTIAIFIFGPRL